jgi:hypothetical protein
MKKLDTMAMAITCALLWAAATACIYLGARFFGYGLPFVKLMNSLYIGARATVKGSAIAVLWALVDGYICGYIFAAMYNMFAVEK